MSKVWLARYIDNPEVEAWLDDRPDAGDLIHMTTNWGISVHAFRSGAEQKIKQWAVQEYMADRSEAECDPAGLTLEEVGADQPADKPRSLRVMRGTEEIGWASIVELELEP